MAAQVFRAALAPRIVWSVILTVVVAFAASPLLRGILPREWDRELRSAVILAAIVVVVALIWFVALWAQAIRVVVTQDSVEVRRPFQRMHGWARASTRFSSSVTQHRTNGLPSGATRALVAVDGFGATTVNLPGMGRRTFNALMTTIAPVEAPVPGVASAPLAGAAASGGPLPAGPAHPLAPPAPPAQRVFEPVVDVVRGKARRLGLVGVPFLVIGVLAALACVPFWNASDELLPILLFTTAAVTVPIGAGLLLGAAILGARVRSIPSRIETLPGAIVVDGELFAMNQLRSVVLHPPAYPERRLRIELAGGGRRDWLLGVPTTKRDRGDLLPDYDRLIDAIALSAQASPGLVRLDRG
ncbi:MAG: hypothetical protein ABW204_05895 [Microbacteriaceae bacterium]